MNKVDEDGDHAEPTLWESDLPNLFGAALIVFAFCGPMAACQIENNRATAEVMKVCIEKGGRTHPSGSCELPEAAK